MFVIHALIHVDISDCDGMLSFVPTKCNFLRTVLFTSSCVTLYFCHETVKMTRAGPQNWLVLSPKDLKLTLVIVIIIIILFFFIFKVNKIIITIINIYEMTCCWQIVLFNCCVLIDRTFPQSHSPLPPPSAASADPSHTLPDCLELPDLPSLPSIPTNSVGRTSLTNDDVDFDDLTRRFEELKKRN